ncbi:hypothetical protein VTO73DRAFT_10112 [Trametes versicolor]
MSSVSHARDIQLLVFALALFWIALYALRHRRARAHRISTLPSLTSSARGPASTELFRSPATRITLDTCHLRYSSTAWNALHQSSTARLAKRGDWRRVLQLAYDVGSVLGVLGMLGSVLLLLWTTVQLSGSLYTRSGYLHASGINGIRKRDIIEDDGLTSETHSAPMLQLIIPGLTTPLHHLPLLLIALLTTQVIHECGHAVAAAIDALPLTSAGVGLTVILPSAFVAFPSDETEALSPRSRARLISAGAFHNLVFWLALGFAARLGTSALVWPVLGYRDVSQYGRVVVGVDDMSPLYGHLPVGAVIYKVGDEMLAAPEGAVERWDVLMSATPSKSQPSLGWCAEEAWFTSQDASCCTARRSAVSSLSCFAAFGEARAERCVDPLRFLQPAETQSVLRCTSATECGHDQLCIRPRGDQELVTLTMHLPPWMRANEADAERTVVWQGDRSEVAEEVDLGDWLPSYSWQPMGLPFVWGTLFSYMKMLTLSLYFFNLLPLPVLDGGQLYDTLYEAWAAHRSDEHEFVPLTSMEGAERGDDEPARVMQSRNWRERRTRLRRAVHIGVFALLGLCIVLSLVNTYL